MRCEVLVVGTFTVGSAPEAVVRIGDPFRGTRPGHENPSLLVAPVEVEVTLHDDHLILVDRTRDEREARLSLPEDGEARLEIAGHELVVEAADRAEDVEARTTAPPLLVHGGLQAARAIHEQGGVGRPLVVVDCEIQTDVFDALLFGYAKSVSFGGRGGQMYRGAMAAAAAGTLALLEVGALPASIQPKLLRGLEEKRFRMVGDNRFQIFHGACIVTSTRDLAGMVARGEFSSDLYQALTRDPTIEKTTPHATS